MRSNEECVAAVKRRVAQIDQQKRRRKNRIMALSSAAVCLAVIVGISFAMPGILEKLTIGDYDGYKASASIFSDGVVAGHIIIGFLAFVLGVCVTVLCFKLKAFRKEGEETGDDDDRNH